MKLKKSTCLFSLLLRSGLAEKHSEVYLGILLSDYAALTGLAFSGVLYYKYFAPAAL